VNRYAIIKKETGSAGRGGRQRKRKECKMERGWKMLGMVVIGFLMLVSGINADEFMRKSEKATQNDIVGTWRVAYQIVRPDIKTGSLFFAKFQLFRFEKSGKVANMATNDEIGEEEALSEMKKMAGKAKYTFVADGLLVIERSKNDFDNIVAYIVTEDMDKPMRDGAPVLKKGDMVFSYLDPRRKLYMQRFLRKIR